MSEEDNNIQTNNEKTDSNNNSRETDAFLSKLSVLTNDKERIEEQLKRIGKAADQIDKYIEMLRGTGLNYTADSMALSIAEIKYSQRVIQQILDGR